MSIILSLFLREWIVCRMLALGKLELIKIELIRYNILICGLSEDHYNQTGCFNTQDYTVIGSSNGNSQRKGVVFLVLKKINYIVKVYKAISNCIIMIILNQVPLNINMIQEYALKAAENDGGIQSLLGGLSDTLNTLLFREITVAMRILIPKQVTEVLVTIFVRQYRFAISKRNARDKNLIKFVFHA